MRVWGEVQWGRGEPSLGPHGKLPKMEFGPCEDGDANNWSRSGETNRGDGPIAAATRLG